MVFSLESVKAFKIKDTQLALFMLIAVEVWFGFQSWLMQGAVRSTSPLAFNTERFAVAFVVMALAFAGQHRRLTRRTIRAGLVMGLFGFGSFASQSFSMVYDPAGRMAFLGSLYIVAMPLGVWLLLRQRQSPLVFLGCGLVLLGGFVLLYTPGGTLLGDLFALIRSVTFAGLILANRRFGGNPEDCVPIMLIEFGIVALGSALGAVMLHQAPINPSWDTLSPALFSGIGGSVTCGLLMLWAQPKLSATVTGVISFGEAPTTALWGLLLGQQVLSLSTLIAFVCIGAGTIATTASRPLEHWMQHIRTGTPLPLTVPPVSVLQPIEKEGA